MLYFLYAFVSSLARSFAWRLTLLRIARGVRLGWFGKADSADWLSDLHDAAAKAKAKAKANKATMPLSLACLLACLLVCSCSANLARDWEREREREKEATDWLLRFACFCNFPPSWFISRMEKRGWERKRERERKEAEGGALVCCNYVWQIEAAVRKTFEKVVHNFWFCALPFLQSKRKSRKE